MAGEDHAWGIDDRTGFKERLRDLRREPITGFRVKNPDKVNPQMFVRGVKDLQALRNARPEPADVFVEPEAQQPGDL